MRTGREIFWVLVFLILGLVAAGFAFAAQAKRIKPDQVMLVNNQCIYPHTPAFAYAIVAAVALLVAHILVNILAGCICCDRGPSGYTIPYGGKRSVAMINFFLAWIAFLNGFTSLVAGASLNSPNRDSTQWTGHNCYVVGPWLFIIGGLLSIATVIFGANYYLLATKIRNEVWPTGLPQQRQDGIAMGQPVYGSQQPPYGAQPYGFGQQGYPQQADAYPQGPQNETSFVPGPAPYPTYGQGSHMK
jgi:hypothetical protein